MKNKMNITQIKEYILKRREEIIEERDRCRGTGVYLAENIDRYYTQVGEFFEIDNLCKILNLDVKPYNPYETEEDDLNFNYWGSIGSIGKKESR